MKVSEVNLGRKVTVSSTQRNFHHGGTSYEFLQYPPLELAVVISCSITNLCRLQYVTFLSSHTVSKRHLESRLVPLGLSEVMNLVQLKMCS